MKTVAVVTSIDDETIVSEAIYVDGKLYNAFNRVSPYSIWQASVPGDPIVYRHFDVEHRYDEDTWPERLKSTTCESTPSPIHTRGMPVAVSTGDG